MKNVNVSMSEGMSHMASFEFELNDGRYHIWVNKKAYESGKSLLVDVIYKNPLKDSDYFRTRQLDAKKAKNKVLIEELLKIVKRDGLWQIALEVERLKKIEKNLRHKQSVRNNRIENNAEKLYNIISSHIDLVRSAIQAFNTKAATDLMEIVNHIEEPIKDLYEVKYED